MCVCCRHHHPAPNPPAKKLDYTRISRPGVIYKPDLFAGSALDADLTPHLMEINHTPSMDVRFSKAKAIKMRLLASLFVMRMFSCSRSMSFGCRAYSRIAGGNVRSSVGTEACPNLVTITTYKIELDIFISGNHRGLSWCGSK